MAGGCCESTAAAAALWELLSEGPHADGGKSNLWSGEGRWLQRATPGMILEAAALVESGDATLDTAVAWLWRRARRDYHHHQIHAPAASDNYYPSLADGIVTSIAPGAPVEALDPPRRHLLASFVLAQFTEHRRTLARDAAALRGLRAPLRAARRAAQAAAFQDLQDACVTCSILPAGALAAYTTEWVRVIGSVADGSAARGGVAGADGAGVRMRIAAALVAGGGGAPPVVVYAAPRVRRRAAEVFTTLAAEAGYRGVEEVEAGAGVGVGIAAYAWWHDERFRKDWEVHEQGQGQRGGAPAWAAAVEGSSRVAPATPAQLAVRGAHYAGPQLWWKAARYAQNWAAGDAVAWWKHHDFVADFVHSSSGGTAWRAVDEESARCGHGCRYPAGVDEQRHRAAWYAAHAPPATGQYASLHMHTGQSTPGGAQTSVGGDSIAGTPAGTGFDASFSLSMSSVPSIVLGGGGASFGLTAGAIQPPPSVAVWDRPHPPATGGLVLAAAASGDIPDVQIHAGQASISGRGLATPAAGPTVVPGAYDGASTHNAHHHTPHVGSPVPADIAWNDRQRRIDYYMHGDWWCTPHAEVGTSTQAAAAATTVLSPLRFGCASCPNVALCRVAGAPTRGEWWQGLGYITEYFQDGRGGACTSTQADTQQQQQQHHPSHRRLYGGVDRGFGDGGGGDDGRDDDVVDVDADTLSLDASAMLSPSVASSRQSSRPPSPSVEVGAQAQFGSAEGSQRGGGILCTPPRAVPTTTPAAPPPVGRMHPALRWRAMAEPVDTKFAAAPAAASGRGAPTPRGGSCCVLQDVLSILAASTSSDGVAHAHGRPRDPAPALETTRRTAWYRQHWWRQPRYREDWRSYGVRGALWRGECEPPSDRDDCNNTYANLAALPPRVPDADRRAREAWYATGTKQESWWKAVDYVDDFFAQGALGRRWTAATEALAEASRGALLNLTTPLPPALQKRAEWYTRHWWQQSKYVAEYFAYGWSGVGWCAVHGDATRDSEWWKAGAARQDWEASPLFHTTTGTTATTVAPNGTRLDTDGAGAGGPPWWQAPDVVDDYLAYLLGGGDEDGGGIDDDHKILDPPSGAAEGGALGAGAAGDDEEGTPEGAGETEDTTQWRGVRGMLWTAADAATAAEVRAARRRAAAGMVEGSLGRGAAQPQSQSQAYLPQLSSSFLVGGGGGGGDDGEVGEGSSHGTSPPASPRSCTPAWKEALGLAPPRSSSSTPAAPPRHVDATSPFPSPLPSPSLSPVPAALSPAAAAPWPPAAAAHAPLPTAGPSERRQRALWYRRNFHMGYAAGHDFAAHASSGGVWQAGARTLAEMYTRAAQYTPPRGRWWSSLAEAHDGGYGGGIPAPTALDAAAVPDPVAALPCTHAEALARDAWYREYFWKSPQCLEDWEVHGDAGVRWTAASGAAVDAGRASDATITERAQWYRTCGDGLTWWKHPRYISEFLHEGDFGGGWQAVDLPQAARRGGAMAPADDASLDTRRRWYLRNFWKAACCSDPHDDAASRRDGLCMWASEIAPYAAMAPIHASLAKTHREARADEHQHDDERLLEDSLDESAEGDAAGTRIDRTPRTAADEEEADEPPPFHWWQHPHIIDDYLNHGDCGRVWTADTARAAGSALGALHPASLRDREARRAWYVTHSWRGAAACYEWGVREGDADTPGTDEAAPLSGGIDADAAAPATPDDERGREEWYSIHAPLTEWWMWPNVIDDWRRSGTAGRVWTAATAAGGDQRLGASQGCSPAERTRREVWYRANHWRAAIYISRYMRMAGRAGSPAGATAGTHLTPTIVPPSDVQVDPRHEAWYRRWHLRLGGLVSQDARKARRVWLDAHARAPAGRLRKREAWYRTQLPPTLRRARLHALVTTAATAPRLQHTTIPALLRGFTDDGDTGDVDADTVAEVSRYIFAEQYAAAVNTVLLTTPVAAGGAVDSVHPLACTHADAGGAAACAPRAHDGDESALAAAVRAAVRKEVARGFGEREFVAAVLATGVLDAEGEAPEELELRAELARAAMDAAALQGEEEELAFLAAEADEEARSLQLEWQRHHTDPQQREWWKRPHVIESYQANLYGARDPLWVMADARGIDRASDAIVISRAVWYEANWWKAPRFIAEWFDEEIGVGAVAAQASMHNSSGLPGYRCRDAPFCLTRASFAACSAVAGADTASGYPLGVARYTPPSPCDASALAQRVAWYRRAQRDAHDAVAPFVGEKLTEDAISQYMRDNPPLTLDEINLPFVGEKLRES